MPLYNYICNDCKSEAESVKGSELTDEECAEVIFETSHAMNPTEAELDSAKECPRCSGKNTAKTYLGTSLTCFVRGYGFLDKRGLKRDLNLFKLQNDDPYAQYRVTGEVTDLEHRLKASAKHQPNPKHILQSDPKSESSNSASMKQAVKEAVNKPGV